MGGRLPFSACMCMCPIVSLDPQYDCVDSCYIVVTPENKTNAQVKLETYMKDHLSCRIVLD